MLSRISIDIVEIVIITSDSYELFEEFQKILLKLQESNRVSRINDKMTKVYINNLIVDYELCGNLHREYNKPARIFNKLGFDNLVYEYYCNNEYKRSIGICVRTGNERIYQHILYYDIRYYMCFRVFDKINIYLE